MFTGLIEAVGEIVAVHPAVAGMRLTLTTALAPELGLGESVAVNGVCLTVVSIDGHEVRMDVSPETIKVTTLGRLEPGTGVNLERALAATARIGGHFVQGHVDAVGIVDEIRQEGESYRLTVRHPAELSRYLIRKGSVAVDGISLTVAAIAAERFDVQIIPFTWQHTTLQRADTGLAVNLETDILGRYVERMLASTEHALNRVEVPSR